MRAGTQSRQHEDTGMESERAERRERRESRPRSSGWSKSSSAASAASLCWTALCRRASPRLLTDFTCCFISSIIEVIE